MPFFYSKAPSRKKARPHADLTGRKTRGAKWKPSSRTFLAERVAFESLGCLIVVGLPAQFAEKRRRQTLGVPAA